MKAANFKRATMGFAALALALPALAQSLPAPPSANATAPAGPTCSNLAIDVYFPAYDVELTEQSQSVIDAVGEQLEGCYVAAISLDVLSEEAHTDEDAAALSEARAQNVMTALVSEGIEPASFKADYARVDAAAPAAAAMVEPMARRVSVSFEVRSGYGV